MEHLINSKDLVRKLRFDAMCYEDLANRTWHSDPKLADRLMGRVEAYRLLIEEIEDEDRQAED